MPPPFADLTLYLFGIVNRNHEYKGFSEFCEFFQQINEPEGGLGEPKLPHVSRLSLGKPKYDIPTAYNKHIP